MSGRVGRPHGPVPLGPAGQHRRHGGQGLGVVDQGRVRLPSSRRFPPRGIRIGTGRLPAQLRSDREEPMLEGGQQPGKRRVALDHFEHGLLLAEEVLLRAGHDGDGRVAGQAGDLHLLDRLGHAGDLRFEGRLQADVGPGRSEGQGGDGRSLDDLVGVAAHERPVLEGAGFPLGRVHHHILRRPSGPPDRLPLAPGREPGAAPTAKPRQRDLLDGLFGPELPGSGQALPAAEAHVVVDRANWLGRKQERDHGQEHLPSLANAPSGSVCHLSGTGHHAGTVTPVMRWLWR